MRKTEYAKIIMIASTLMTIRVIVCGPINKKLMTRLRLDLKFTYIITYVIYSFSAFAINRPIETVHLESFSWGKAPRFTKSNATIFLT